MASLPFPDSGTRMVLYATGKPAAGLTGELFSDRACTHVAEVYADENGAQGLPIGDGKIVLDQYGQQPTYWGPTDGTDRLYLRIGGVVSPVDADYNARIDAQDALLADFAAEIPAQPVVSVAGHTGVVLLTADDVAGVETPAGAQAKADTVNATLAAHAVATTSVHGIADTGALETGAGAQAKANAAQAAAIAASDPVGTGQAAVNVHAAVTTNVHGIADMTNLETVSGSQAKANAAAAASIPIGQKGATSGVASLGVDGKLSGSQVPALSIVDFLGVTADEASMLALVGQPGDWTSRTDLGTVWLVTGGDPTRLDNWTELSYPTAPVTSVAGRTGSVVLTSADVGLGSASNTSDANKPVSTAAQTALDLKAPLASPAFTGTVTGVTKAMVGLAAADNTADVDKPISTDAQAALDLKAPLDSPAFTGTPTGITKSHVGLGNADNTSDEAKPLSTAATAALAGKADDNAVVHDSGDETVDGVKTFTSAPVVPTAWYHKAYTTARREILATDPLYGTPGTRAAFINALDAAETLGPYTTVRIPAGLTVDVGNGLALTGRTACIKGDAAGIATSSPFGGNGSVVKATTQTGPVLDYTGWIPPYSFRGVVEPVANLTIQGSGAADATKANTGLQFAALGSAYVHDIAIQGTGGPCLKLAQSVGNATYLNDFERIHMFTPVLATTNDVPYFYADECNGNRLRGFGFRANTGGEQAGPSGVAVIVSNSTFRTEYVLLDGWWWENTDLPTNGCLLSIQGNGINVRDWQIFDCGKTSGATNTAHFRVLPAPIQDAGANTFLGYIPGVDPGDPNSIDAGIVLGQSWNLVTGPKGYKGTNVVLNSGVDHCDVYLYGSLGNATVAGIVDNSGMTNNHLVDGYTKTEVRPQAWTVNGVADRSGTGAPTSIVENIGATYKQTDGGPGTSLWGKSQVNGSSIGWHPFLQEYLATASVSTSQALSSTSAPAWLITATGDFTFTSFSGARVGGRFTVMVKQDATGGRIVTFPGTVSWQGGAAPILSTAPNAVDVFEFVNDGTNWQELGRKLAWQAVPTTVQAVTAADHNLGAWTYDIGDIAAFTVLPAAGTLQLIKVPVRQKTTVANIVMYVGTAGATLTAGQNFAALYTSAGALIGTTADQAANWVSTGLKTMALTGGPYTVQPGYAYVGLWYRGTTSPAFARTSNVAATAANIGLAAPNLRYATANTALTTTAPSTLGTQTATAVVYWAGLS